MKRILSAALILTGMASCTDSATSTNETVKTDTAAVTPMVTTETTTVAYVPSEGDVMLKNGHVMVYRKAAWGASEGDVTLDNGVVVSNTGEIKSEGKSVRLSDGETVSRSGNFFDRTGNAISNGWDATKHGVSVAAEETADAAKAAGKAIKKGAQKVGEKTKEIVNGN